MTYESAESFKTARSAIDATNLLLNCSFSAHEIAPFSRLEGSARIGRLSVFQRDEQGAARKRAIQVSSWVSSRHSPRHEHDHDSAESRIRIRLYSPHPGWRAGVVPRPDSALRALYLLSADVAFAQRNRGRRSRAGYRGQGLFESEELP